MTYDLIVVGAGPAGASAAAEAARQGLSVALLEKCALPRHKTCGGGMPMTVGDEILDLAPSAFVESDVRFMRHSLNFADAALGEVNPAGSSREIVLWMAQRAVFDYELAMRAARLGADLREETSVESVEIDGDGARVRVSGPGGKIETLQAAYVIGADGANGVTARCAGLRRNRALAIGMEVEAAHQWGRGAAELRPDTLHLDYGVVRDGYAWVFPKGDHLNVGAGVFRQGREGKRGVREDLQRAILAYLDYLGVPAERDRLVFHAHPLPLWNGKEPLNTRDGRILLVGDSAGMINPLFGDGILHAVRSGLIAARSIVEGAPLQYTARLHALVAGDFEAARRLSGPFYKFAGVIYKRIVRRPSATRAAARLLAGDAVLADACRKAMNVLRRSLPFPYTSSAEPDAPSNSPR